MGSRLTKVVVAVAVIGGGYYAYTHLLGGAPHGGPGMMGGAPPVSVAEVISRKVDMWNEFSGKLVAVDSAEIRPRVSGTIEKVHFTEGQWVEKGQSLFTIDQRSYQAALESAQASATLANSELGRAKTLLADKAVPQREYDQRKNNAAAANAALTRAQLDYEYTLVKSPIAGRVGRAEITAGNLVDAGGNAPILTTVVANKPIYADFDIDEQTFLKYLQSAGSDPEKLKSVPVNLLLSGQEGAPRSGAVQSFDNKLNTGSGTLRVRAIFDNKDGSLIPGLFARVQLGVTNSDENVKFVWVVGDDNKVSYRPVTLGPSAQGLRVITEGLKPGEKIAINGIQRVMMPGQAITSELVPMDAPPKDPAAAAPAEKAE
jgi:multidrug efflux system membrane fusion protein